MIFIAHRGNLEGPKTKWENHPDYINEAIQEDFDVEIDLWSVNGIYYLGHDEPQYKIKLDYLLSNEDSFWCHAKNLEALNHLVSTDFHCFWHQEDSYILTSDGWIWTYPGHPLCYNSIAVMPERNEYIVPEFENLTEFDYYKTIPNDETEYLSRPIGGICSDYIVKYHNKYKG